MENSETRTSYARADSLLSSCPYSRPVALAFLLHSCRSLSFPSSELANRFTKPASRPARSAIRHGSDVFSRKIDRFRRFPHSSVHEAFACSTAGRSMGPDAFVFLLSPFLFSHLIPFYVFFSLTTSHNPNGILSNI